MWNIDRLLLSKNDLSLKSQFIRSFLIAMFLIRLRVANPQIAALLIKEKKTKRNVERKKINKRTTKYYLLYFVDKVKWLNVDAEIDCCLSMLTNPRKTSLSCTLTSTISKWFRIESLSHRFRKKKSINIGLNLINFHLA